MSTMLSRQQIGSCLTKRVQELILLPTEKCNFRCTYCYEDFLLGRMPERVQRGIENLISARAAELDALQISWFGGEPLLATNVILRIAKHAFALSNSHGFKFGGGFTTNGYLLTRTLAEQFIALNQNFFQISLDGWGEAHDVTRQLANGGPTFDRIWTNLIAMKEIQAGFDVVLRLHLSPINLVAAKKLCEEIGSTFNSDDRFRVDFQDIRDMGGKGGESVAPFSKESFAAAIRMLTEILSKKTDGKTVITNKLETIGESASMQRREDINSSQPYICYAAKPNSLLVRSNGRIGKCTVAFDNPANDVGEILEDGTLDLDNGKLRKWFHGFESLDLGDLACPVQNLPRDVNPLNSSGSIARQRDFPVPVVAA